MPQGTPVQFLASTLLSGTLPCKVQPPQTPQLCKITALSLDFSFLCLTIVQYPSFVYFFSKAK